MINTLVLAAVMMGQVEEVPDEYSMFVEFTGGINFPSDVNFLGTDIDLDEGGFFSLGIGLQNEINPTLNWSLELEYSYHNADVDGSFKCDEEGEYCKTVSYDGDITSHAFMINAVLTQALFVDNEGADAFFFVYGGGGVGISHNRGKANIHVDGYYPFSRAYKVSTNSLAWHFLFGIGYQFSPTWTVKTGGRYFDGGEVSDALDIDAESWVWELGVSWGF